MQLHFIGRFMFIYFICNYYQLLSTKMVIDFLNRPKAKRIKRLNETNILCLYFCLKVLGIKL